MMPTRTTILRATAALGFVIGLGHVARAQPARPVADDGANAAEAAKLYDEGKRHFDIAEYAQAIASWKQSYLRSNAPLLLFNIAQAYRLSNNCAQANRFYLNYRRSEPHPKNQAEFDKAIARCAGVEPATGDATTSEPPTSQAAPPAPAPTSPLTTTSPGEAASSPAGQRATASPMTFQADHAAMQPSNPGGVWRTAGLITAGVGAATLGASGVYAFKAKQDSNTVSGSPAGTQYRGEVASADRSGQTAASRAQGLVGVGAVLAVAGGAMWYFGHSQANARVDVTIGPGHTEVTFSCAF